MRSGSVRWRPGLLTAALFLGLFAPGSSPLRALETVEPQARPVSAPERILAEAQRIVANVRETKYSHSTKVDEKAGKYETDCSGLAALILKAVCPEALQAIRRDKSHKRPLAFEFYEAFSRAPAGDDAMTWRRIVRLADARPGDFIAWRKAEIVEGENTGHVVLVAERPEREEDGLLRVVVIDSTSKPHSDDTRRDGGVGRGTVWFQVDENGRPVAYRSVKTGKLLKFAIAIGRVVGE